MEELFKATEKARPTERQIPIHINVGAKSLASCEDIEQTFWGPPGRVDRRHPDDCGWAIDEPENKIIGRAVGKAMLPEEAFDHAVWFTWLSDRLQNM